MKKFFLQCQKRRAYGFTYSKENAEKAVSNPTISDGETYVRILSDDVVKSNFGLHTPSARQKLLPLYFLSKQQRTRCTAGLSGRSLPILYASRQHF
jgi:phage terminase small subunit